MKLDLLRKVKDATTTNFKGELPCVKLQSNTYLQTFTPIINLNEVERLSFFLVTECSKLTNLSHLKS